MRWVLLVAHLVACISDPWATLGVPRSASQKDIKKGQVTIFPIYESFLSKIASYVLVSKKDQNLLFDKYDGFEFQGLNNAS